MSIMRATTMETTTETKRRLIRQKRPLTERQMDDRLGCRDR